MFIDKFQKNYILSSFFDKQMFYRIRDAFTSIAKLINLKVTLT